MEEIGDGKGFKGVVERLTLGITRVLGENVILLASSSNCLVSFNLNTRSYTTSVH